MSNDIPAIDRPMMPDGYGVPADSTGLLDWADVQARLVASLVYWLATTRPDGPAPCRPPLGRLAGRSVLV